MIVGIQGEILKMQSLGLLEGLLMDKTTKTNIIWATDAYKEKGKPYERDQEITVSLITGENSDIIKNRARKAMEHQSERTKAHAEVFTPLWICRMMNDHTDIGWFYKNDPHPFESEQPVRFLKTKKWQNYVDARRLEITCGEAPYLVSRYDVSTGESIPIGTRTGILDRKLRVVNENTESETEWLRWAIRAFQATYGYEFQGDNLLIARLNLLMTFEEYLETRWKRKPTLKEYHTLANIISWNIWQMDGLTGTIPYCKAEEENCQLDLFTLVGLALDNEKENKQPVCRVYDWRRENSCEFHRIQEGGTRKMKFDFIIGNPPYQDETLGENKGFAPPIYHRFLDGVYAIADKVCMIHPARFLFNAGSTPKAWNEKMLSDKHLKVLWYEAKSSNVFANTDIKGGVAVTYRNGKSIIGPITIFTAFAELNGITQKVGYDSNSNLTIIMSNQLLYNLTELYAQVPELRSVIGSDGKDKRFRNNAFEKVSVFTEVRMNELDIEVIGLLKNRRVKRYIKREYVDINHESLFKYKVLVPRANGSGALGEVLSTPLIGSPLIGYTQSFIGIGAFEVEEEAQAAMKYIKTKFARCMLGVLKSTQDNPIETWKYVPLQDFTPSSDIDWSQSIQDIDRQLYAKYGLNETEVAFIESHVKEMA